jgi:hypothetical protein
MRVLKISVLMLACAAGALALSPARAEWGGHRDAQSRIEHMCSDQGKDDKAAEFRTKMAEHVAERLKLTDAQKSAFKDLQDFRAKTRADAKAALCASKPDLSTFEKKLEFRETMMQRRLDTLKAVAPKLIAFRNTLDDTQKGEFDHMLHHMMKHRMGHGGWSHHGGGEGWRHHERDDD